MSDSDPFRTSALQDENERLRTYAERYFRIQSRLPAMVKDAARHAVDGMSVTLCKEGCRPFWRGDLRECPRCGSRSVRTAKLVDPEGLSSDQEGSA